MAKAQWTAGRPSVTTDPQGTLLVSVDLLDGGTRAGTFTFTITADRALVVKWSNAAGSAGLADFRAWSTREG